LVQATPKRDPGDGLGIHVRRALREGALLIFAAVALLLFVALATFHPLDPGYTFTGEPGRVENAVGPTGAWLASLLYLLFGYSAYLIPIMVVFAGWKLYQGRGEEAVFDRLVLGLRTVGFFLTLATASGLAALHGSNPDLPASAGGILGQLVGVSLAENLSFLGATLIMLALWLAGASLFTGVSWLQVMDGLGAAVLRVVAWASDLLETRRERAEGEKVKQVRSESVKAEREKVAARPKPRIEPTMAAPERSVRAEKERQATLFAAGAPGELPALSLLDPAPERKVGYSPETLEAMSRLVEIKLKDFGIDVEVVAVNPGPVVTRFELQPAAGVKVAQIVNLSKDLARALSAIAVRVVEIIPGKSVIGLEIPNETRELVTLGQILESRQYDEASSPLTLAMGKDISGFPVVADLSKMPHLLVAGTTGSGKSVAINAMVLSLLYKSDAETVRLIMIDPKMLELSVYEGIPHLLAPVVTDMKEAANALRWCVAEMERRYRVMAAMGVRNLSGFNRKINDAIKAGTPIPDPLYKAPDLYDPELEPPPHPTLVPLPHIVVIIDELADMMMIVGKKVEELIARLAQKARASGIHLILATQRPSVDVITGLIKANIPCRVAFQVSSRVDSRTILDGMGAESLLGHGDMLYVAPGSGTPERIHGAFVSDHEVHRVVEAVKQSASDVNYIEEVLTGPSEPVPGIKGEPGTDGADAEQDELYDQALRIVTETRKASISGVQRRLKIGYNRAARLVEAMEEAGVVGPVESNGQREVLAPPPPKD
jgi:DNA segregation ATPase FtsK/SpoIIIE, S-DNA-T family